MVCVFVCLRWGERFYGKLNDTGPNSRGLPEVVYSLILLHPYLTFTLGYKRGSEEDFLWSRLAVC